MGRPLRAAARGIVYHILNCAPARRRLFEDDGDYGGDGFSSEPVQNGKGQTSAVGVRAAQPS